MKFDNIIFIGTRSGVQYDDLRYGDLFYRTLVQPYFIYRHLHDRRLGDDHCGIVLGNWGFGLGIQRMDEMILEANYIVLEAMNET